MAISPLSSAHRHPFQRMCVRTSTAFYGRFILSMDRSPGFGSMYTDYSHYSHLVSLRLTYLRYLTLPVYITRRTVLQKVRDHPAMCLPAYAVSECRIFSDIQGCTRRRRCLRRVYRRRISGKIWYYDIVDTGRHIDKAFAACRHRVSGSLSLPSRGSFHLSLTVLFSIGH